MLSCVGFLLIICKKKKKIYAAIDFIFIIFKSI